MPLPTLTPWRLAGSAGDTRSHAPVFPALSDGKPTSTQSLGTSHQSGPLDSQTHKTSTEPSSLGVSRDSGGSPSEPLPDEPRASGNVDGVSPPSSVYGKHIAHHDHQGKVPMSYVSPAESIFETIGRIDEMAEVTRLNISPSSTHRTSVLGARASEPKTIGEGCPRTFQLV